MTLEQVRAVLATHRVELSELGIAGLSVFGSVARGEAGPDSDVNMLVDLDPAKRVSRFGFVGIQLALEDLLGVKVDLVERSAVRERWREDIENEAVRAA
ncbi:MAG: nucleotidyltransferase family protein [Armatimonadetes bacterium]|nr:nucleotidyltransferase family protein [Armatimonadota bacterium]